MLRQHSRQEVSQTFRAFPPSPHCLNNALCSPLGPLEVLGWESSLRATWTLSPGGTCLPCPGRAACSVGFLALLSTPEDPRLVSVNTMAPKVSQHDLMCHCISHIMSFICSKLGPDSSSPLTKATWISFPILYFHCDPRLGELLITIIFDQIFF